MWNFDLLREIREIDAIRKPLRQAFTSLTHEKKLFRTKKKDGI